MQARFDIHGNGDFMLRPRRRGYGGNGQGPQQDPWLVRVSILNHAVTTLYWRVLTGPFAPVVLR